MSIEKKTLPPADRGHGVGVIIFVLGLGILTPWNFFATASEYLKERLKVDEVTSNSTSSSKDYQFDSWMTLLSQLPLLLFTMLNSLLYHWVRERIRVVVSLCGIFILFSITATLVTVQMEPDTFFSVILATIWFINMCSAVLQASLFGVVGLFPQRYSTLFMSGQGLAGMFAATAMLFSILSNADTSWAALGYFITPCVGTLVTLLCYLVLPHLDFAKYYLNRTETPTTQVLLTNSVEDAKILNDKSEWNQKHSSVLTVFKKIWLMALCFTFVFATSLSVFPVITVRVRTVYKDNKAWERVFTCVCCFVVFNAFDFIGRSAPSLVQWPRRNSYLLPLAVLCRLVFVPLIMMCNIENSKLPVLFKHDAAFVTLLGLFSFSNGYLATLCMTYAPQMVRGKDCETAGSLMTFFLVLGLAGGAAFSFLLGQLV